MNRTHIVALALVLAGCAKPDVPAARDTTVPVAASKGASDQSSAGGYTVTEAGYGPLNIGMTVADAAAAVGAPAPSTAGLNPECGYPQISNIPPGVRVMAVHDTVARVDVDSGSTATGTGVRIGDSEARVRDAYGSRLTVQPHKYVPNGHYMTISPIPPTDTGLRLIFETDGARVTTYRAGRVPEVQMVEHCG